MARSIKTGPVGQSQPHAEGAQVSVIQELVHDPIGTLAFRWGPCWPYHAEIARQAFEELQVLHAELVDVELLPGNVWLVSPAQAAKAYQVGTSMVTNAVRTVRHLAQTMASEASVVVGGNRALDDLRAAALAVGIDCRVNSKGYHHLAEMVGVRDAVEHPSAATLYQGGDSDWDKVPLAWILSDRSIKAFAEYGKWLDVILHEWKTWHDARPRHPTTLTVQRGMGSMYPAKQTRSQ